MESRNDAKKLIKLFIVIAYGISAVGDFIWIRAGSALHPAAFIPGLAPTIAAVAVYYKSRKEFKIHLSKCSIKQILCCIGIPVIYFVLAYIAYSIFKGNIEVPELHIQYVFMLIIQFVFMAILEEVGWRGILLPLMQQAYDYKKAIILNGLVWAVWHYPMILAGFVLPYADLFQGIVIFTIEVLLITKIIVDLQKKLKMISIWPIIFLHAAHDIMSEILVGNSAIEKGIFIGDSGYIVVFFMAVCAILLTRYKINYK